MHKVRDKLVVVQVGAAKIYVALAAAAVETLRKEDETQFTTKKLVHVLVSPALNANAVSFCRLKISLKKPMKLKKFDHGNCS